MLKVDSVNSHVRKLRFSSIVHRTSINRLSRLSDSAQGRRGLYFQAKALYLSLGTRKGVNTSMFF